MFSAPKPPTKGKIIGLDCHPDIFAVAVFRGSTPHDAQKLGSRENMSLEALMAWARKECSSDDLFLMEAGSNSFEICRRLQSMGFQAVVLESCHVGRHAKTYADNDKMAAARIALVYLAGNAPCVWQPDPVTSVRRELLHAYQRAVDDHTATVNAFKGFLNQSAIRLGKRGLHDQRTREWILKQCEWNALQRELLSHHFADVDTRAERRKTFVHMVCQQICAEPLMLRCMKILGIGKINAFALLAIIGDVKRFHTPEKLVAYLGLNPGQRDSGTRKRIKLGIGNRGRGDMRRLLIQGAQAVLRTGKHTALGKWGVSLFVRKGNRNIAVAAVARKMAVQAWHMLRGNPPTVVESDKSMASKLHKLIVVLGKKHRAEIGLPPSVAECVRILQEKMVSGQRPAT